MDEYLKECQSCKTRQPAKWFRYVLSKRVCLHCADYLEMEDAYRPQPLKLPVSRQRAQQLYREPPARWNDRKGHVPHWMKAKEPQCKSTQARRNKGKPDVMDARVPPRKGRAEDWLGE